MTPGLVAALLEGFEGTLDVALEQIVGEALRHEIGELRVHIAQQRQKLEEQEVWI